MRMLQYSLPVYTPAEVQALDRYAIEVAGIPGHLLMARAGRAAWQGLRERVPQARQVLVLCGGGNNGGDGYVIARLAADAGWQVTLCPLVAPDQLQGDAAAAAADAMRVVVPEEFSTEALAQSDVVVDALLGTGLDRPVTGAWAEVIDAVNAAGKPLFAIDVPSGLSARTGQVLGCAIRAQWTMSFIGRKQGLYTGNAPDYVGELLFDDLGVPASVYASKPITKGILQPAALPGLLPRRRRSAHKGHFGHVLVIGGDHGMGGAVRIAGEAAARTGAGLVSVATRPVQVAPLLAARPELMVHGVEDMTALSVCLSRASVVALGPGLGQADWGQAMFNELINKPAWQKALVVDADGLNLLALAPQYREDWILTPHPGEAARLLDCTVAEIEADRFAAVDALVERYGGVVVLKGAGTLIGDGSRHQISAMYNPGMASGGMGDALTGIIAGLLAQGLASWEAANAGVLLHAQAAKRAAVSGERGLLASDLLSELRSEVNPTDAFS